MDNKHTPLWLSVAHLSVQTWLTFLCLCYTLSFNVNYAVYLMLMLQEEDYLVSFGYYLVDTLGTALVAGNIREHKYQYYLLHLNFV